MIKKSLVAILALFAVSVSTLTFADDINMTPPKPVENKVLDQMVGTWKGESDMAGVKMHDTLKISWSLNHQFLVVNLVSKNVKNPKNQYNGLGMFGLGENGNVKVWWFDSWGATAVSTGTGSTQNNQLVINDSNGLFKEQRSFNVKSNELTMKAKGSMTMNGKESPFEQTVIYKR